MPPLAIKKAPRNLFRRSGGGGIHLTLPYLSLVWGHFGDKVTKVLLAVDLIRSIDPCERKRALARGRSSLYLARAKVG